MNALTRKAALLYLAATFVVGGLAGAAAGFTYGRKPRFRPFDRDGMRQRICGDLSSKLGLTEEQKKQLEPLVQTGMEEFGTAHKEHVERIRELKRKGDERISSILTPEQKAKFDAYQLEREKDMPRGGPGDKGSPKVK